MTTKAQELMKLIETVGDIKGELAQLISANVVTWEGGKWKSTGTHRHEIVNRANTQQVLPANVSNYLKMKYGENNRDYKNVMKLVEAHSSFTSCEFRRES